MKTIIFKSFVLEKSDAEKIKEWNAMHTKSITKLAKTLGIARQYLYRLMNGKEKLSARLYKKMCKLGIFNEELL